MATARACYIPSGSRRWLDVFPGFRGYSLSFSNEFETLVAASRLKFVCIKEGKSAGNGEPNWRQDRRFYVISEHLSRQGGFQLIVVKPTPTLI